MAIYRYSNWRPSAILELFYHHTRPLTKSLLLSTAACQILCQSDTQVWRYSYLNFFAYLDWNAYSGPQNGSFGGLWTPKCDYSSLRYPKGTSLHKSTSFKLSTVKIRWGVWPVGELTESVTDTHTQTHTGKFIFCPCIALDRQQRTWNDIVSVRWHFYANCTNYTTCLGMSQIYTHIYLR